MKYTQSEVRAWLQGFLFGILASLFSSSLFRIVFGPRGWLLIVPIAVLAVFAAFLLAIREHLE